MASYTTDFLNKYAQYITKVCVEHGLLPSVGIAQAILESGWGRSGLTTKGNALYGIKATQSWKGKRITSNTFEYYNGNLVTGPACFRAYDSPFKSIDDYADFLQLPRYSALKTTKDPRTYCMFLKSAGYATAIDYVESLMGIIKAYNLTKYDKAQPAETVKVKTYYTVKPGDSWWRIANEQLGNGMRFEELARFNGMTSKTTIYPGQVLRLPE